MKYILTFLGGACIGAGVTMLFLRKGIKKEMEEIRKEALTMLEEKKKENEEESDIPFTMGKEDEKQEKRTVYSKVIKEDSSITIENAKLGVPVPPRAEEKVIDRTQVGGDEIVDIDKDDFKNDESYRKKHLIFYKGDQIMSTENGAIISAWPLFVGYNWEDFAGKYVSRTAFIRNFRMNTDYEIYIEYGSHSEEWGTYDGERED